MEKAVNNIDQLKIEKRLKENGFRYERKFRVSGLPLSFLLHQIKTCPALFRPLYAPRQINNIYFDTTQFRFFYENVHGLAIRKKIRLRWYGKDILPIENPQLEYKFRHGQQGNKWVIPLPGLQLDQRNLNRHALLASFKKHLPALIYDDVQFLSPALVNTYQRRYFISADQHFRLTLDQDMRFFHPQNLHKHYHQHTDFIIELKYLPTLDEQASEITTYFDFRMTKNSKYVNGIEQVYPHLIV